MENVYLSKLNILSMTTYFINAYQHTLKGKIEKLYSQQSSEKSIFSMNVYFTSHRFTTYVTNKRIRNIEAEIINTMAVAVTNISHGITRKI